MIEINPCY